ncbi:MAG: hypothetical protein LBG30_00450, partial [Odoribacteraceae bacterium]|nr:hypothetical protein [Odoribacteraceae bacterium]
MRQEYTYHEARATGKKFQGTVTRVADGQNQNRFGPSRGSWWKESMSIRPVKNHLTRGNDSYAAHQVSLDSLKKIYTAHQVT